MRFARPAVCTASRVMLLASRAAESVKAVPGEIPHAVFWYAETVNWSIAGCCSEIAGYYSGTADSGMAYPEIADSGKAVPETEYFPESRNYFRVWQSGYRTGCRIYIEAEVLFHSLRNT